MIEWIQPRKTKKNLNSIEYPACYFNKYGVRINRLAYELLTTDNYFKVGLDKESKKVIIEWTPIKDHLSSKVYQGCTISNRYIFEELKKTFPKMKFDTYLKFNRDNKSDSLSFYVSLEESSK